VGYWRTIAVMVGWLVVGVPTALGDLSLSIRDTSGDPNSITGVTPGTTFTIEVWANSTEDLRALEGLFVASQPGVFDLVTLSYGQGWNRPGQGLALPFNPPVGLDPAASTKIGSVGSVDAGQFLFATVGVKVDPAAAPGTYTIELQQIYGVNSGIVTIAGTFAPPVYTVVIPGPAPTPALQVTPADQPVASGAGTTSFAVANAGGGTMPWTAQVSDGTDWLSITSGASGTDAGTIQAAFTANASTQQRVGTIRVTATGVTGSPKDVTVTQQGATVLQYTLTTNVVAGYGAVDPTGGTYAAGTTVTLTAAPNPGWRVKAWTGTDHDPSPGSNNNTVTMNGDRLVEVEFELNPDATFQLAASVQDGHGTVLPASGVFNAGTVVTLTATPDPGYRVKAWTGTDNDPSAGLNTTVATMDRDRTVTVEFEALPPQTHALSAVVAGGHGTVEPATGVFNEGTVVALTATPDAGFRVKKWSGTDNDPAAGNNTNLVTMSSNRTVVVEFEAIPPPTFTLEAAVAGGHGSVTPAGGVFDEGTVVTLVALPHPGFRVKSWSGTNDDASKAGTNAVTMTVDRSVTVTFEATPIVQYLLTAAVMGSGGLVTPTTGVFNEGTVVVLTATPDTGFRVKKWSGTDSDPSPGSNANTVIMDRDRAVTVEFEPIPADVNVRTLAVFVVGGSGMVVPASGVFDQGTVVTLRALPDPGFRVQNWIGTDDDTSTALTNTVTMNTDRSVAVAFQVIPIVVYQLTVTVVGEHGTVVPSSGPHDEGSVVMLTATPDAGFRVKAWTGTDQDPAAGSDTVTATMNGDRSVTVEFEPIPPQTFDLTASVTGGHGTVVPASGNYDEATVVTLQAVPDSGYRVSAWTGTDNDASTEATATVTMNAARQVTVEFAPLVDCNQNQIDDAIDIANNTSTDSNANGIPDECETDSGAGNNQSGDQSASPNGGEVSPLPTDVMMYIFGIPAFLILLAFLLFIFL